MNKTKISSTNLTTNSIDHSNFYHQVIEPYKDITVPYTTPSLQPSVSITTNSSNIPSKSNIENLKVYKSLKKIFNSYTKDVVFNITYNIMTDRLILSIYLNGEEEYYKESKVYNLYLSSIEDLLFSLLEELVDL